MALCAGDAHFEPERAFFGHFDGVAPARARIRHDIEILRAEKPGRLSQQVFHAVAVARLFIGHEDKTKGKLGRYSQALQFLSQHKHADQGLLIVFHAASVEHVALAPDLPGVRAPGCRVARRHNVRVAEKPERAGARTGQAGNQVGPQSSGNARIRRVHAQQIRHAARP